MTFPQNVGNFPQNVGKFPQNVGLWFYGFTACHKYGFMVLWFYGFMVCRILIHVTAGLTDI